MRTKSCLFAILFLFISTVVAHAGFSDDPFLVQAPLVTKGFEQVGVAKIWNGVKDFHVQVNSAAGWKLLDVQIYVGQDAPPSTKKGDLIPGLFTDVNDGLLASSYELTLDLVDDLGIRWGLNYKDLQTPAVSVHVSMARLDGDGYPLEEVVAVVDGVNVYEIVEEGCWAYNGSGASVVEGTFDESQLADETVKGGYFFDVTLIHPRRGHFIDCPVGGLFAQTPTQTNLTEIDGAFDYFPGEIVTLSIGQYSIGSTIADHKISPLDIFPASDTEDIRVINMARLLQSFDSDADPKGGITITAEVVQAFEATMSNLGFDSLDFSDDAQIDAIIDWTIVEADLLGLVLEKVSAEDAKGHLDDTLNNVMFRKMISRTPELGSAKAKMNISTVWFPALRANGEPAVIEYFDEDGVSIRTTEVAKPIIVTFTDADPVTGAHDAWAAISRDDGNTWKRKNISRSGDRTSFTLENGEEYYGYCKKPVFQVKGNKILMAWTSKYARGGKPAYAIAADDPATLDVNEADDYPFDDPYWTDDIWGVGGPQRSVDYVEQGFPEVGEVPYSAVWTCRGMICTQADIDKTEANGCSGAGVGDIVWFKPERLTSGRRDANLIFLGAGSGAGFGMVWQEDPKGLRPGRAVGPGPGWGGATTHHKTDIWYSYVTWGNHSKVDEDFVIGSDPEHEVETVLERPKALVPMSLPVRISDNDVLNQKNMMVDMTSYADDLAYVQENLTRCVKFEGGKSIVQWDDPDASDADYAVLNAMPDDHQATMNCTNCHVPYGQEPMADIPTQGSAVPLVVIDAETNEYLGGFDNGDCVSCHFSHIVPRDRLIAMAPGTVDKCAECEASGGIWKDGTQEGGEIVEAYFPYDGYPYIYDSSDDQDGTHRYGLELPGLLVEEGALPETANYYDFINFALNPTSVGVTLGVDQEAGTADDLLMDGDTGAARGNIFLQPYTKPDGTVSAWAIITYEETKGAGAGPPVNTEEDTGLDDGSTTHRDDYLPESGKNVIYHSFDFQTPDLVSAGDIMNQPECEVILVQDVDGTDVPTPDLDDDGNITPTYLETEEGAQILDWKDRPQLAYENARRGRFILQGKSAIGDSRTVMLMVYKMGAEGAGRPSDIMMQRWVAPLTGNPYSFDNIVGNRLQDGEGLESGTDSGQWYWASGPVNMSSVTPTVTTPSAGDPDWPDAYGEVKVVEWAQTADNLADLTSFTKYDDARAHRGQIRGDFVQLGFSYTANWAASRNGNDKYDFFIRRSFDGGATWTTDPAGLGVEGAGVEHCITWTYPTGTATPGTKVEECNFYAAGAHETMRNLTQLPNNKESVIEPRIVAVPGTIKDPATKLWTEIPEDKQNANVFYVAWGTSSNPKKDPETGEQEEPAPADLYWSFSMDKGENYFEDVWYVNGEPDPDSVGGVLTGDEIIGAPWMAKGDQEQGEVQLRMTPDGSRFYASWLDEGEEGSDIVFRRIMPADFEANNVPAATE